MTINSIELRRKVHSLKTFDEFFGFVEKYKEQEKVFAFCYYAFMEKRKRISKDEAKLFLEACTHKNLRPMMLKILGNMANGY